MTNNKLSERSRIPPCPGRIVPESLRCVARLRADSKKSPSCATIPSIEVRIINESIFALPVITPNILDIIMHAIRPAALPSILFRGLILGQILWLP